MSDTDTVDTVDTVDTATPVDEEGDGEEDGILVAAAIHIHGRRWTSEVYFTDVPDDATLAEELVNVLTAVSVMRGQGLWFEVQRRMRGVA